MTHSIRSKLLIRHRRSSLSLSLLSFFLSPSFIYLPVSLHFSLSIYHFLCLFISSCLSLCLVPVVSLPVFFWLLGHKSISQSIMWYRKQTEFSRWSNDFGATQLILPTV